MTTPLVNPFGNLSDLRTGAEFMDTLHQRRVADLEQQSTLSLGVSNPYGEGIAAQEPNTLEFAASPNTDAVAGEPAAAKMVASQDQGASGLQDTYAKVYYEKAAQRTTLAGDGKYTTTTDMGGGGSLNLGATLAGLNPEQQANAKLIAQIAIQRGLGARGALIGIMTAMTESSLRNISGGDRDSVGLFQQRPSQGWGTVAQIRDPNYAINKFFDELSKKNYNEGDPWVVAQSVQRSAFSDGRNFRKYYDQANQWVASLFSGGGNTGSTMGGGSAPSGSLAANVIAKAKTMLGTYYVWGGTTSAGVDCSGLIYYALNSAGYKIPRYRAVDYGKRVGTTVSASQARPGDLVYWDEPGDTDHVGIYLGNGQAIQAPTTGQKVKISNLAGWTPTSFRRILPDSAWA